MCSCVRSTSITLARILIALAAQPHHAGAQSALPLDAALVRVLPATVKVLVDIRISDDVHTTLVVRAPNTGGVLLPLQGLMAFAGIRTTHRFGTISARGDGDRPQFRIDQEHRAITIGKLRIPLVPGDVEQDGKQLYVSTELAERLLNVSIDVDLPSASVLVRGGDQLPAARRRAAIRSAQVYDVQRVAAAHVQELMPRHRTAVQADYNLLVARAQPSAGLVPGASGASPATGRAEWAAMLQARVSARVAGGSLSGRIATGGSGLPVRDVQWSHYRPTSRRLTHVLVGAIDAGGMTGARVHGLSFDNHVVDYSERRTVRVRGRAESGWEYTVRQDGGWSADDRPGDGSYEFRLPMTGDIARVDVFGWGPNGEERRFVRSVHAVPMRVQKGELQYSTAAGRCANGSQSQYVIPDAMSWCRWFAGADTRVGLTDWLVARTGIDAIPGTIAPYVGAAGVLWGQVTLQAATTVASTTTRHGSWSAQYEPSPTLSMSISKNTALTGQETTMASLRLAPLRWEGRFALDGWMATTAGVGAPTQIGRVGLIGMRNSIRLELFGSRTTLGAVAGGTTRVGFRGNATGVDATAAPAWLRLPGIERTWISGTAERATSGEFRSTVRLAGSMTRAYFEISRRFSSAREAGRWALTITPRSRQTRQTTLFARNDGIAGLSGGNSAMHSVSGSAAWEAGARRVSFSADQATGRGTIIGRTFLDLNNDGQRGAHEPFVGDVPVTVANTLHRTDSTGWFRSNHMTVAEMIDIAIDSTALPSPCWRASARRWRVRATEGGLADVMLPIRRGGILEGRILRVGNSSRDTLRTSRIAWDDPPRLRAVSTTSGESFDLDVFSAGTFYQLGIPFGTYDILMSDAEQRRIGVTMQSVRVEMKSDWTEGAEVAASYTACPLTTAILRAFPRTTENNASPAPRSSIGIADLGDGAARPRPERVITPRESIVGSTPRERTFRQSTSESATAVDTTPTHTPNRSNGAVSRAAAVRPVRRSLRRTRPLRPSAAAGGPGARRRGEGINACDPRAFGRMNVTTFYWSMLGCQRGVWRKETIDMTISQHR